jgi:hypothetical protein
MTYFATLDRSDCIPYFSATASIFEDVSFAAMAAASPTGGHSEASERFFPGSSGCFGVNVAGGGERVYEFAG